MVCWKRSDIVSIEDYNRHVKSIVNLLSEVDSRCWLYIMKRDSRCWLYITKRFRFVEFYIYFKNRCCIEYQNPGWLPSEILWVQILLRAWHKIACSVEINLYGRKGWWIHTWIIGTISTKYDDYPSIVKLCLWMCQFNRYSAILFTM
jgi:hypothetical protein